MKPILEIQNISKKFRIQHEKQTYLSVRDSIASAFKSSKSTSEEFFALKDVSFDVSAGESIGIIGKNGAGKSTLLKILSKITPPTFGKIVCRGRVASLLEVGTGFHPELSGRENIFLNGSILGMKRSEILSRFNDIVDFSETEKFIDTPLKHYSSGMQLRLAFSVAAFLEPEILIIDEVLAVGDAEFQKKCLGKMEDVSKNQGRTLLFVSHQMGMISQLCPKAILLDKGQKVFSGKSMDVVNYYNDISSKENVSFNLEHEPETKDLFITKAGMYNKEGNPSSNFAFDEEYYLQITFKIKNYVKHCVVGFHLKDKYGRIVFTSQIELDKFNFNQNNKQEHHLRVNFPKKFLTPNQYSILGALHIPNVRVIDSVNDLCVLNIIDTGSELSIYEGMDYGCVFANCEWLFVNT